MALRVLFCGEEPVDTSPTMSIVRMLAPAGMTAEFTDKSDLATSAWIRHVRSVDLLLYVDYRAPSDWFSRQAQLANMLGRPLVRWWVGTDVLLAMRDPDTAEAARRFDRAVAMNIAVASHLADELSGIGVSAETFCIAPPELPRDEPQWTPEIARTSLVYLPDGRLDFYGAAVLERVARALPDARFVVVGYGGDRFAELGNVECRGPVPVAEMDAVYARVGSLLRVTEHDGLPRMVLEAQARGKYVLYSWPLEGCTLVRNAEDAVRELLGIRSLPGPNASAMADVRERYDPVVLGNQAMALLQQCLRRRWFLAGGAACAAIPGSVKYVSEKLRRLVGRKGGAQGIG